MTSHRFSLPPLVFPAGARPPGAGASGRLQCRIAANIVAAFLCIPAKALFTTRRAPAEIAHARHVAIYLAHVGFQVPVNDVADAFGRDRSSVGYALARIEDERDDAGFDRVLAVMEALVAGCREVMHPFGPGKVGGR